MALFKKVQFEGAFNRTFKDVEYRYYGGSQGEMIYRDGDYYIRGVRIPIRKDLHPQFVNEFIKCINSDKDYIILKFLVDYDGGYMVKSYCGNKADYVLDRIFSFSLDGDQHEWEPPR